MKLPTAFADLFKMYIITNVSCKLFLSPNTKLFGGKARHMFYIFLGRCLLPVYNRVKTEMHPRCHKLNKQKPKHLSITLLLRREYTIDQDFCLLLNYAEENIF